MAKLLDQGPVLVLTFQAQQLTVRKSGKEESDIVSASDVFINNLTCAGILHVVVALASLIPKWGLGMRLDIFVR